MIGILQIFFPGCHQYFGGSPVSCTSWNLSFIFNFISSTNYIPFITLYNPETGWLIYSCGFIFGYQNNACLVWFNSPFVVGYLFPIIKHFAKPMVILKIKTEKKTKKISSYENKYQLLKIIFLTTNLFSFNF